MIKKTYLLLAFLITTVGFSQEEQKQSNEEEAQPMPITNLERN